MPQPMLKTMKDKIGLYILATAKAPKNIYLGRYEMNDFLDAYEEANGYRPNTRQGLEYQGLYIIEVNLETHLGVGE